MNIPTHSDVSKKTNFKYFKVADENKNILILPGWGTTLQTYSAVANFFNSASDIISAPYNVFVTEYSGFGKSPEPPFPYTVSDYAEVINELCKSEKFYPDVIFAHSMGCRLTAKIMSNPPENFKDVKKIIITGGAGISHSDEHSVKQNAFKFAKKVLPKSFSDKMKRFFGSDDYRNATPLMRDTLVKTVNEDLTDYFPLISTETLLVWGELDSSAPLTDGQKIEKLMPNAGLAVIKGAGHFCFVDQPSLFFKICATFLNS